MAQKTLSEIDPGPIAGDTGADPAAYRYVGRRGASGPSVMVVCEQGLHPLPTTEDDGEHGHDWGRRSIPARELSRAILIDATGNQALAERLCRPFTWEVVACLPTDRFIIGRAEVLAWIEHRGDPSTT